MEAASNRLVRIINPLGEREAIRATLAKRLKSLDGRSIGFIDNIKPNAGLFIRCIEDMLRGFTVQERKDMIGDNGRIGVTCEFCSTHRDFDPKDFDPA